MLDMLPPPPGTVLPRSPLVSARWVKDIVNLDGPLLAEFRNQANEPILFSWCDRDEEVNRWLAFRVQERDLIKFTMRRTDLRSLVANPIDGFLYVVDIDAEFRHRTCSATDPTALPQDYMPDEGAILPQVRSISGAW